MKNLYIVKNITSAETNSAGVFKQDATIGADTYSLIKTNSRIEPIGEDVQMLSYDEFDANLHSFTFGGDNGEAYRKEELRFSEEIATAFSSAQSGLSSSDGNSFPSHVSIALKVLGSILVTILSSILLVSMVPIGNM